MKTTRVSAGVLTTNHNETMVRDVVRARGLKVRTGVKGGKKAAVRKVKA